MMKNFILKRHSQKLTGFQVDQKSQEGISMGGCDAVIQLAVIQKEKVQLNVSWAKY